jgi:hypothetical protein
MFVAVAPFGNIEGLDWMWLAFAAFVDVLSLFGQFGGSRNRMPGYDRY